MTYESIDASSQKNNSIPHSLMLLLSLSHTHTHSHTHSHTYIHTFSLSWISSVNQLLDNLDTNVGDVVENQVDNLTSAMEGNGGNGTSGIAGVGGESSVDDILAKRGLLNEEEEEEEEEELEEEEEDDDDDVDDDDQDDYQNDQEEEEEKEDEETYENIEDDEEINFDQEGIVSNGENDNKSQEDEDEFVDANDKSAVIDDDDDNDDDNEKEVESNEGNKKSEMAEKESDEEFLFEDANDGHQSDNIVPTENVHSQDCNGSVNVVVIDGGNGVNTDGNEKGKNDTDSGENNNNQPKQQPPQQSKAEDAINVKLQQQQKQNAKLMLQTKQQHVEIAKLKKALKEQKKQWDATKKELNSANKETRKLRRNVVKINAALDSAEHELDAQRTELDRAAVRMEKERQRYKDDKERLEVSQKEDMKAVMEEHKTSIDTMVTSHAEQMVDMEERIKRAEEARAKEGGDMSMELAEAAERERETLKKVLNLEEEKSTMTSQIASLNTQLAASQSRVEALQEAAEVASEQEREADDRLDAALSLHARQIGQRQAREAELERTVADIAAALVVARQREAQEINGVKKQVEESDSDVMLLKERLNTAEDEIETFKAQIMLERQKSETLQKELEDVAQERTQELSTSLARQKQHDRRVADLTSEVTQLQSKLRSLTHIGDLDEEESEENVAVAHFHAKEMEYKKEIAILTEDLLRQRGRLENSSTEVLTLRNRLRAALNRAEVAEREAKASSMAVESNYDIERGPLLNSYGSKPRRRFAGRSKKSATIRSILKLDSTTNESQEAVAGSIDSIDLATVKTLNVLRSDPFSRLFFIVYLVVLHLWIFCLLAFHAHGTLEPSSNVGPEQLLKHSYRHMEQVHGKH